MNETEIEIIDGLPCKWYASYPKLHNAVSDLMALTRQGKKPKMVFKNKGYIIYTIEPKEAKP